MIPPSLSRCRKINHLAVFLLVVLTKDHVSVDTNRCFIVKNRCTSLLRISSQGYEATKPFINNVDPTQNPTTKHWNKSRLANTPIPWIVTMWSGYPLAV